MAEESGKGIALVILGIVAIIAIVGLVLLFTGARKAAVGEFAVPGVKEYGGAIRGVADPYSRAFSGRAREYPSGNVEAFSGQWPGSHGVMVGGESYGDIGYPRGQQYQYRVSYNRQREEIPSMRACEWMSQLTFGSNVFGTAVEASDEYDSMLSQGRKCMVLSEMRAADWEVLANEYGLDRDKVVSLQNMAGQAMADGAYACCENPGLLGTV